MKVVLRLWLSVLLLVVSLLLGIALARPLAVPSMAGSEQPVYEFIGPVVSLPEGIFGTWIIGQTRVEVTAETQLDRAKRKLRPGIWVQVRGERIPTGLQARAVRVLSPEAVPNRVELHGVVEETSDNTWVVSGTRVTLTSQTRIVGPVPGMYGTSPVGAVASVTAFWEGTTLVADIIRLRTLAEEAQEVEFLGRLEAVRGNVWVVDGVEVTVPEGSVPPPTGTLVSVTGQAVGAGRVRSLQPPTVTVATTEVEGWILQQSADAGEWELLVDTTAPAGERMWVTVPSDTPVDERAGRARPGARVTVRGIPQADARLRATFVRVADSRFFMFTGTLTYIPSDVYAFPWTVGETQVWVRPSTVTDRPLSEYRLGDRLAVSGWRQPDGTVVALMLSRSKR